jgi:hypothetical protein
MRKQEEKETEEFRSRVIGLWLGNVGPEKELISKKS